jgi:hypothetical protein
LKVVRNNSTTTQHYNNNQKGSRKRENREKEEEKKTEREKGKEKNQSISLLHLNAHQLCCHLLDCHRPRIEDRESTRETPLDTQHSFLLPFLKPKVFVFKSFVGKAKDDGEALE